MAAAAASPVLLPPRPAAPELAYGGAGGVGRHVTPAKKTPPAQTQAPAHVAEAAVPAPQIGGSDGSGGRGGSGTYSYEQLKSNNPSGLPAGVDAQRREDFLSDADFEGVFGIERGAFKRLPGWKRVQLRKKMLLF